MPEIVLPFSPTQSGTDAHPVDFFSGLQPSTSLALQEASEKNPHLLEYLYALPIGQIGIPEYYSKLSRNMTDIKKPNLIYPISQHNFTHILFDLKDARCNYIPVEPILLSNLDSLVPKVEDACIAISDMFTGVDPDKDKAEQLLWYIEQVTTHVDERVRSTGGIAAIVKKKDGKIPKIKVTKHELEGLKYIFIRDKIGLGILEPLMADPYIEDISCSGLGHIFIEHKIFKSLKSTITFSSLDELDQFVVRMAERIQKSVTYKSPISDATLPDGSRINMVFGRDVSKRGSNFTIRKFNEVPLSVFQLVDYGTMDYQMLGYLSLVIGNGMNVFVSGETASGKTTLLNAVTTFISPLAKVVTIEDTPELQIPHKNWIREVVQTTKMTDPGGAVTMFDLLRAALRQRPNEILVGEIRGPEGNIAFQAMQTGHSVMATFHAATVEKLIQRITSNPISVPKSYIDNLNVVILMSMVKLPGGRKVRRVTSIAEIVGWDPATSAFKIVESFRWNHETDKYEFTGKLASYILENKIASMIGIPHQKRQRIYGEVERRAKIFERLHRERGITGFYEVLQVLAKAQKERLL
jgi:archaeal flagellar protein FlaI